MARHQTTTSCFPNGPQKCRFALQTTSTELDNAPFPRTTTCRNEGQTRGRNPPVQPKMGMLWAGFRAFLGIFMPIRRGRNHGIRHRDKDLGDFTKWACPRPGSKTMPILGLKSVPFRQAMPFFRGFPGGACRFSVTPPVDRERFRSLRP